MRRVLVLLAVAVALVALPAANRAAAAPCASGPMGCCSGMGDEGAPPCPCSWNAVPPAPAAVDAPGTTAVVLAEAPLATVAIDASAAAPAPVSVAPRARSAPLFLLFSVLLV